MIEAIGSMPDTTPRGSDGASFRQVETAAGAWVSPTGSEDPDSDWTDDEKTYDEDTDTYAYTEVASGTWSPFLTITPAAGITSDKIRFNAYWITPYAQLISKIDVDVYKDGVWTDVFLGYFLDHEWEEKSFSQGVVTKARVRFYCMSGAGDTAKFYEFDFWDVSPVGGDLIVVAEGQYLATEPSLDDEDLHYLRLTINGELITYPVHVPRTPHYIELPHGANTDVWEPAGGKSIHATSIMVSVESAGLVEIFHDATLFMKMHFNEKRAVPIGIGGDLTFAADVVLKATFTADNTTDSAYITAIGHEH